MSSEALYALLCRRGPVPAADIQRQLGISQSSFQRHVAALRSRLLVVGRARGTRYAARREIQGVQTPIEIFEFDVDGASRHALTLHPIEPLGFYVERQCDQVESGFHGIDPGQPMPYPHADLPFFLHEIGPSGFLGRAWLREHDADYPPLSRWTGDDVLRYAVHYGMDLPGAFAVGAPARDLSGHMKRASVEAGQQHRAYPELASRALTSAPWGSSPGGDQPKFTTSIIESDGSVRKCIVKFSPPTETEIGQRWADLLMVEHLVHVSLSELGVDSTKSCIIDGPRRRFLEVERSDRHGASGRSGLISLLPFDTDGVASDLRQWRLATESLVRQGHLSASAHQRVQWLTAFGHGIANTDMHLGNLSLRLRGTTIIGLAPVYDMLPMFHAPRHGEIPQGLYRPRLDREDYPRGSLDAARESWRRVIAHQAISNGFKAVAREQLALL